MERSSVNAPPPRAYYGKKKSTCVGHVVGTDSAGGIHARAANHFLPELAAVGHEQHAVLVSNSSLQGLAPESRSAHRVLQK